MVRSNRAIETRGLTSLSDQTLFVYTILNHKDLFRSWSRDLISVYTSSPIYVTLTLSISTKSHFIRFSASHIVIYCLQYYWQSLSNFDHILYIYQALQQPVFMYGSECWRALKTDMVSKLDVFHNSCFKSILQATSTGQMRSSTRTYIIELKINAPIKTKKKPVKNNMTTDGGDWVDGNGIHHVTSLNLLHTTDPGVMSRSGRED